MGAGLFITTVVLGTVLIVARSRHYNIGTSMFLMSLTSKLVLLSLHNVILD